MSIDFEKLTLKKPQYEIGKIYSVGEEAPLVRADIEHRMKYCEELLAAGQEEDAAYIIDYCIGNDHMYGHEYSRQGCLKRVADKFTDKAILYRLILSVYTMDGYNFPRSLIIKMKSASSAIQDEERLNGIVAGDPVTVYRASITTDKQAVRNEISWTTNYDVAVFFAYKEQLRIDDWFDEELEPLHIWKAEIPRNKIIAYTNDREEYEVIQHRGVQNPVMLMPPTEEEINRIFQERI